MDTGYIKLYRQMMKWEWYTDIPTKVLFIHLLFRANHEAQKWRGIEIKRGQLVTSYRHLAEECGLTLKQVRTALEKLKSTNEAAHEGQGSYSIITVKNWDKFQEKGKERAHEGQGEGKVRATNKNEKNEKNERSSFSFDTTRVIVEENKKLDPYINPVKTLFIAEYQKVFGNKPFLSNQDHNRIIELAAENSDIQELIPVAIARLKNIDFDIPNFKPTASWLLKGNNFERVMNGEFEKQKNSMQLARERLLRNAAKDT